jgi:molybdopterin-containing oxidoreductase family iron-sulfur binding subunit
MPNNKDRFGPSWQEQAKRTLAGIPFDSELGREAARDAQRLAAGSLSEQEFYLKYHEAYLKEFGLDLRPLSLGRNRNEILADSFLEKPANRRTVLKVAGGGILALSLNSWLGRLTALAAPRDDIPRPTPVQYGMLVDLENCDGCLACVAACRAHNALDEGVFWLHIISFTDSNQDKVNLLPRLCNHCTNAPCIKVCPVGARFKRDDGIVLIDYDLCIGCRYCMVACPYGVNYFAWDAPRYPAPVHTVSRGRWVVARPPRGVMGKCDFCPERQDDPALKGTVVCAEACPHGVLQFGDMNDPNSTPNVYLARKKQDKGYISTFRLQEELGTRPNNLYIGQQPSASAKLAPLPLTYEEVGWIEERKEALQRPPAWFLQYFGGR